MTMVNHILQSANLNYSIWVWGDVCVSFYIYRGRDARCSLGNIITLWQLVRDGIDKGGRGVVQCVALFVIIGNVPPRIEDLCVL